VGRHRHEVVDAFRHRVLQIRNPDLADDGISRALARTGQHMNIWHGQAVFRTVARLGQTNFSIFLTWSREYRRPAELSIAAAAGYCFHNFGMPSKNIPQRQFLEPGIKNADDAISVRMAKAGQGALDGKEEEVLNNMNAVGVIAASSVKSKITAGPFVPLGESTLAARRRRGRTGTKPLIDTGQLRNSISYVIRAK